MRKYVGRPFAQRCPNSLAPQTVVNKVSSPVSGQFNPSQLVVFVIDKIPQAVAGQIAVLIIQVLDAGGQIHRGAVGFLSPVNILGHNCEGCAGPDQDKPAFGIALICVKIHRIGGAINPDAAGRNARAPRHRQGPGARDILDLVQIIVHKGLHLRC